MTEFTYCGNDGCPLYATIIDSADTSPTGGERLVVVLLHGGGPDYGSLIPLAA